MEMKNKKENDIYNPKYVEQLFDKMSGSYERINVLFSFGFTTYCRNAMMRKIEKTTLIELEILDLMTGMGETWEAIKQRFPQSTLTGLDISEGMLSRAERKSSEKYDGAIILKKQNVLNSDLESDKYDVVVSAFGLKTFSESQIEVLAQEVKRVLKPGGRFVFIEISAPENFILNQFYRFYLGKVTPVITKLLLGDPVEYRMLWEYTRNFNDARRVAEIFNNAELKTEYDSYFFGCATGIHGVKL